MLKYEKVDPPQSAATAYRVTLDGKAIGYVWSRRGFSYRGTQGWNAGVRIRDYHPWEWCCGFNRGDARPLKHATRKQAAERLVELFESGEAAGGSE